MSTRPKSFLVPLLVAALVILGCDTGRGRLAGTLPADRVSASDAPVPSPEVVFASAGTARVGVSVEAVAAAPGPRGAVHISTAAFARDFAAALQAQLIGELTALGYAPVAADVGAVDCDDLSTACGRQRGALAGRMRGAGLPAVLAARVDFEWHSGPATTSGSVPTALVRMTLLDDGARLLFVERVRQSVVEWGPVTQKGSELRAEIVPLAAADAARKIRWLTRNFPDHVGPWPGAARVRDVIVHRSPCELACSDREERLEGQLRFVPDGALVRAEARVLSSHDVTRDAQGRVAGYLNGYTVHRSRVQLDDRGLVVWVQGHRAARLQLLPDGRLRPVPPFQTASGDVEQLHQLRCRLTPAP